MPLALVINGITYNYPQLGDELWGEDATNWAQAVTLGMLQKSGGLFQLTSEVDFGTNYGIKALTYKTRSSDISTTGQFRLSHVDVISWRNLANDANLGLAPNPASDILAFNSIDLVDVSSAQTLTNKTLTSPVLGGFTASRAVETDGSGNIATSSVTSTELGFVSGLSSPAVGTTQAQSISGKTFTQNLIAGAHNTFDLGSNAVRWKDLFLQGTFSLGSITYGSLTTKAIANNTTETIFEIAISGNQNIIVTYSLSRGTAKEAGKMLITCDGTNVQVSPYSVTIGTTGVEFNVDINGANIRLRYTSDNGTTGSMQYHTEIWGD